MLAFFVLNAFANPTTTWIGVGVQHQTVASSLGFQRYHSGLNVRRQTRSDNGFYNQVTVGWTFRRDQIPNGYLITQSIHSDITRGVHFRPTELLELGFYGGISPSVFIGGLTSNVSRPDLQLVTETQIRRTTNSGNQLWFSGGYRIGFYGVSPQVQWGWGRLW